MANPYIGEIIAWPCTFAPQNYLFCDGSILSISQYDVLFSLIGTTYGGDGQTTFALPDLRGRVPLHAGQRPGGQFYQPGQTGGVESVSLNAAQLPSHGHALSASGVPGNTATPTGGSTLASLGPAGSGDGIAFAPPGGTQIPLAFSSVSGTGSGLAHDNMQPTLTLNYIIAVNGIYPGQN